MLYKKYHRNFVSQFKRGVNFDRPSLSPDKIYERGVVYKIKIEPHGIYVIDKRKHGSWILVYSDGIIKKKSIYVIQKIS